MNKLTMKIITVLDCCHSGKFKLYGKGGANAAKIAVDSMNEKSAILEKANGKCLLAASQGEEEVYPPTEEGHSIFTHYLLKGLRRNKLSVNVEGKVTADSLIKYVYAEIMNKPENKRPKQTPIRKKEVGI
jgi:uncharacterized caspase-like protein